MLGRYLLPPDVYIRHWLVSQELNNLGAGQPIRTLDVGGSLGELKKFPLRRQVTTVDVTPGADYVYDGRRLPFENDSYHSVVSIDTLEHIPPEQRLGFIKEMMRVAKNNLILIAPFASPEHVKYEQRLKKELVNQGQKVPQFLTEHLNYGLVDNFFVSRLKKNYRQAKSKLAGNVFLDRLNFDLHFFSPGWGKLSRIIYLMKLPIYFTENILTPLLCRWTNNQIASRILIVIRK